MFLMLAILSQLLCFINKSFFNQFYLAVVVAILYYSPPLILQPYGAWRFVLANFD